jgi:N6-L-threonylcarbamoyladenine synthase
VNLLTLETTCDETAAAIITDRLEVLASVVASQDELHRRYGGVVPEIASRAHVERVLPVIDEALRKANLPLAKIDAVAVANTPGLAGSLLVGLVAAKAICLARGIPLISINHLQAHVYACRFSAGEMPAAPGAAKPAARTQTEPVAHTTGGDVFPCIGLIVSGGHSSLYRCDGPLDFQFLGGTIDDAAGEAFDKVASMLGLSYPGGPSIERAAKGGNPRAYCFPRPFLRDRRLDFSFSGLKTAVRYAIAAEGSGIRGQAPEGRCQGARIPVFVLCSPASLSAKQVTDLAASFQEAAVDCLVAKAIAAMEQTGIKILCVGGGVAANGRLRQRLQEEADRRQIELHIAPLRLCTDNAVMGAIALERWKAGLVEPLDLDVLPGVVRH